MKIQIDIELTEFESEETMARVYYPNEGNKIILAKGLNRAEVTRAIYHEIGHVVDWYLSKGDQSEQKEVREEEADRLSNELQRSK